nr:MAG TPA: hypothetical protein [Caudoviricetes sp.]
MHNTNIRIIFVLLNLIHKSYETNRTGKGTNPSD